MAMTSEQVEAAAKMLGEGLTYSQIGARLGLTRNTVIGKMARVGLATLTKNRPSRGGRGHRSAAPSLPALPETRRVEPPRRCDAPAVTKAPPPPARARIAAPVGRVTLMELGPESCRYGHGDPRAADFRFCGKRAANGPFCGYHAQLCYEPARGKR